MYSVGYFVQKSLLNRNSEKYILPDFFGMGAQKSATTWISQVLSIHKDIFIPEKKEIHYFNDNFYKPLSWYSGYFKRHREKIKGEITPAYAILDPKTIELINKLMPEIKIIYLMRNPIDRAWSHAKMYYSRRWKRNLKKVSTDEFMAHFKTRQSRLRGDYITCIDNWLSFYPQKQLFLGYYEQVEQEPKILIKAILEHINAPTESYDFNSKVLENKIFEGESIPIPEECYAFLNNMYKPQIIELHKRYQNKYTEAWLKSISQK